MRLSKKKLKDVAWRNISEMIKECEDKDYVGEFLIKKFDSEID